MLTGRITSYGAGQQRGSIQPKAPTASNSKECSVNSKSCRSGKPKRNLNVNFFAWMLLHKKILTANNLVKRHWPNDPICKLCGNDPETTTHLCKDYTFTKQVWFVLKSWFGLSFIDTISTNGSLHSYWRKCLMKVDKPHRKAFDGLMIYFWWNIWKDRNRRTFQNKSLQAGKRGGFLMQRRGRSISMGNKTKRGHQLVSVTYVVPFPFWAFCFFRSQVVFCFFLAE